jgi:hypothetical protein
MRFKVEAQFGEHERRTIDEGFRAIGVLFGPGHEALQRAASEHLSVQKHETDERAAMRLIRGLTAKGEGCSEARGEAAVVLGESLKSACLAESTRVADPQWVAEVEAQVAAGGAPLFSDPVLAVETVNQVRQEQAALAQRACDLIATALAVIKSTERSLPGAQDEEEDD